jgi:aspartate carbamoyltransferase catalytic subunit
VRHRAAGAPHFLSRVLNASVVNAGDGAHEHPTQALLDTFTIREKKGRVAGLKVTILGDILYSRVARSNIWCLTKLGAQVTLAGPSTLVPRVFEELGCRVTHHIDEAIEGADVINLLRIQHERQRKTMFPGTGEYASLFGLNPERLRRTKPDAIIMHPGPINRGVEIDSDIADGNRSVILEQVTNGLAVRMAVLFLINGGKGPQEVAA